MKWNPQTDVFAPEDITNHKAHALCAYLHIFGLLPLFLVPLLAAPDSKYARFHADQGLTHYLTFFIGGVILWLIPILGWILLVPFWLAWIILAIIGIVNATQGKTQNLPIIGRWTIIGPKEPPKETV